MQVTGAVNEQASLVGGVFDGSGCKAAQVGDQIEISCLNLSTTQTIGLGGSRSATVRLSGSLVASAPFKTA